MKIGYARVSTKHQRESLDEQIALLRNNAIRPELTKVLEKLKQARL